MPDQADHPEHPLLKAATLAADGQPLSNSDAYNAEEQRVAQNLSRLSALKAAFDRLDSGGEQPVGVAGQPVPGTWGHLQLQAELGRGGFGVVYRAFDPILQREVALKLQREDLDVARAGNWIEEARKLARVRHPNVLAVHGADVNEGRAGLWSDLLQGETLAERLHGERVLSRSDVIALLRQLSSALDAIHAAGLMHGDVKPANVMLEDRHAVLMDFGAAAQSGASPRFGTPGSTAPELLDGGRASGASDVYSLGVLLCRAALPADEREGRSAEQAARNLRRRLGAPLQRLLLSMLRDAPALRPTPGDILAELTRIESLPQRRARHAALAAVLLTLSAGLAASLWQAQEARRQAQRATLEAQRAERSLAFLTGLFRSGNPRGGERVESIEALLTEGVEKAREDLGEDPVLHGTVLLRLAEVYLGRAEFVQARDLADQALALLVDKVADEDRRFADAHLTAGGARYQLGERETAERQLREAARRFRQLDDVSKETQALGGVAGLLRGSQNFEAALALQQQIVNHVDARLGPQSYQAAAARFAIGVFAIDAGDYALAERELRTAIGLLDALGEEGAADRAAALLTLASLMDRLGRPAEAGELFESGIAATASLYGEGSQPVASATFSHGIYLLGQKRPAAAEASFRAILAGTAVTPILRAHAQRYLGRALIDQLRLNEAIEQLIAAESAYRALGGVSGEEQAHRSAADRARAMALTGNALQALPVFAAAIAGIEAIRGERHYNLIQPLIQFSAAQQAVGETVQALASAERALAMAEAVLGAEHRFSAEARAQRDALQEQMLH